MKRLGHAAFVVWGAVTVIFLLTRVIPGDPAILMLGPTATTEQLDSLRQTLGLNEPLLSQYVDYIVSAAQLDFGESFRLGGEAIGHVLRRAPASLTLAAAALAFVVLAGFPLGIAAARKPQSIRDKVISASSLVGQSLPTFWVGIMLILLFAGTLKVLPSGGSGSWKHVILPAITLGLPFVAMVARLLRSGLLEESHQGYVQTARAKGLKEPVVFYVHVLRNVLVPVVTVLGLIMGLFVGSAVIIEIVFAWPGIGKLLVDSILYRDYAIVQAAVALIAVVYVMLNLLVDMTYGFLDPRIRLEES